MIGEWKIFGESVVLVKKKFPIVGFIMFVRYPHAVPKQRIMPFAAFLAGMLIFRWSVIEAKAFQLLKKGLHRKLKLVGMAKKPSWTGTLHKVYKI